MLAGMSRIVYGKRPLEELLANRADSIQRIYLEATKKSALSEFARQAQSLDLPVHWVDHPELEKLCGTPKHQGLAAEVRDFSYTSVKDFLQRRLDHPRVVVVLDGVTDPQNFGSCLRAAGAFGADLAVTTKNRGCPVTPVVVRVSAGATETVAIARETNLVQALERLKEAGFWVYGLAGEADRSLAEIDLSGDIVLILGSEGEGMHRLVREHCDAVARIPADGPIESLNVAQACTVGLYEIFRQRGRGK